HPGMNTRGMVLVHLAYNEVYVGQVGLRGEPAPHVRDVLGIGEEEEGMPLAAEAPPPAAQRGRDLDWFLDLLARAREHTLAIAVGLSDSDLERQVVRRRADGSERAFNLAWVFHHILQHEAGHRYQINLLTHLRLAMEPAQRP